MFFSAEEEFKKRIKNDSNMNGAQRKLLLELQVVLKDWKGNPIHSSSNIQFTERVLQDALSILSLKAAAEQHTATDNPHDAIATGMSRYYNDLMRKTSNLLIANRKIA